MLLLATGWQIKQIISQRREEERRKAAAAGEENALLDDGSNADANSNRPSSDSAFTHRRYNSSGTSLSHPSTNTSRSSGTSASSLWSEDRKSTQSMPVHELESPRRSNTHLSEDYGISPLDRSQRRVTFCGTPNGATSNPWNDHPPSRNRSSTVSRSPHALGEYEAPYQTVRITDADIHESISPNAEQQLIQQMEQAFQDVEVALADVRSTTNEWQAPTPEKPETVRESTMIVPPSPEPPMHQTRASTAPVETKTNKRVSKAPPKAKKLKFAKQKNHPDRPRLRIPQSVTSNVADVFKEKLFGNKIEVDEMLTPGRLQKVRENQLEKEHKLELEEAAKAEEEGRRSEEMANIAEIDGTEYTELPTPTIEPPPFQPPEMPIPQPPRDKHSSHYSSHGGLMPPPREDSRASYVPFPGNEDTTFSPLTSTPFASYDIGAAMSPYLVLRSTSFTLTAPTFKHGSIRLERTFPTDVLRDDGDALDWTAFQMAILGTIDDYGGIQRYDSIWEDQEIEVEEMCEWFASFGFPSAGGLEQEESDQPPKLNYVPSARNTLQDPAQAAAAAAAHAAAADAAVEEERRGSVFSSLEVVLTVRDAQGNVDPVYEEKQLYVPEAGLEVVPYYDRYSLRDSYQESPGGSQRVFGVASPEVPNAQMGFNLNDDIGDFLSWEAQHMGFSLQGH